MNIPVSNSSKRMGRPPLNVRATQVRLGAAVRARIDAVLKPKEKMAAFIREAVERELKRREARKRQ